MGTATQEPRSETPAANMSVGMGATEPAGAPLLYFVVGLFTWFTNLPPAWPDEGVRRYLLTAPQ